MELNETPNSEQAAVISRFYVRNWDGMKFYETSFWRRERNPDPTLSVLYITIRGLSSASS
jgi:hypothetical protein